MVNANEKVFDFEKFKSPDNRYDMVYGWAWNAPVTKEGIDQRLADFEKAGIKAFYILPLPKDFRPETIRTFLEPDYLSDEFMELIKYAHTRAEELGMTTWIYDEGGWPSGGACWHTFFENPEAPMQMLERREIILKAGEKYAPEEYFVALYNGNARLPDDFISDTDVTLSAYYAPPTTFNGNRADCTNASVTDTFISNTYETYKRALGDKFDKIPLIFTDEPGMQWGSLAHDEFRLFEEEYGYDLRDYLHVIEGRESDARTDEEIKARIDHFSLMGRLVKKNFAEKLAGWCEENQVAFGGHLDLDHMPDGGISVGYFSHVDILRQFHVPGIDVIWEQIRYPYDDRTPLDNEAEGCGFFPLVAASAARQSGRNITLSESMGVFGDGLTPDEIRYVLNYQAVRGINSFNFLTATYGKDRCEALLERPLLASEKPGFFNMKHINEYYARVSYLLRLGEREGDTALYHPSRDYAGSLADKESAIESYKALGTSLEERNIPFDIIDEYGILDAEDTGDGLKLGSAIYRHIAVPKNRHMPDAVKKKIEKYLGEGEPICAPKSKKLRFMTRKVDNSRLWFIFNEGIETVNEVLDIAGGKHIYRIDARLGEMYKTDKATLNLVCGDMAIYLVSDEIFEVGYDEVENTTEISGFKISGYDRFNIDRYKITTKYFEGEPTVDENFSGTVHYIAEYTLPFTPDENAIYVISLDGFSVSARVSLDGEYACDLGMTPMEAIIPRGMLKESGIIEIAVSNTAAGEIIAKDSLIRTFPEAEVGPYHVEQIEFEKRRPELKFGRVYIEKIERTK